MKQWLLEVRNATGTVGKVAIEAMDARVKKWRARRDKDPMLRLSRVGSAVEMVTFERSDSELLSSYGAYISSRCLQVTCSTVTVSKSIFNHFISAFTSTCH